MTHALNKHVGFCAGLYGVLRKFIGCLLKDFPSEAERPWYALDHPARGLLRARGAAIRVTAEFGRPYREITRNYRSWQLDEWLHFLETFSLLLLTRELMDSRMWRMWTYLRYVARQCIVPSMCC